MDRYTKFVLTVIAVALVVIAFKGEMQPAAQAGVFSQGPTVGEVMALRDIKDPAARKSAEEQLRKNVPLIWIQGGNVHVAGQVGIDQ